MRKIICDRCSRECSGTTGQLSLSRAQFTKTGEMVTNDVFASLDLCDICTEVARTEWGFKVRQENEYDMGMTEPVPELAMEAQLHRGSPGHYTLPEDSLVPRRLAVGMVVDRDIATRWNERRYGEDPAPLVEAARIELCGPGGAGTHTFPETAQPEYTIHNPEPVDSST
jgi:hypothetical protein